MTRLISNVYRMGPRDTSPDAVPRIWRLCRNLWDQQGTIVVKPAELPEHLRGPMTEWANDHYGERHGK